MVGRGWHRETFGETAPTRQMLDRLVPDRPAWILEAGGRTAWVNTKALELARMLRPAGAARNDIPRDARRGEPSALLDGSAFTQVEALVPAPSASERERALRAAVSEAHRLGITSVQDVNASLEALAAYAGARRAGDLRLRIYSALPVARDMNDAELDQLQAALARYPDDPLFKAGAMSLTLDDASTVTEAVMADQAAGPASTPAPHFAANPFNRLVRRLDARGWQVLTRAGGDLAVRMALDAYEHAVRSNPSRTGLRRHRIEGPLAVADSDVPRFEKLAVLASLRPFEMPRPEGATTVATTGAAPAAIPLARRFSSARGRLAFGSGWPAAPLDPLLGLSSTIGAAEDQAGGGPRLSLKLAIDAYTSGSAWASFDEQRKGTIAAGMLADLVVLSRDIFKGTAADLGGDQRGRHHLRRQGRVQARAARHELASAGTGDSGSAVRDGRSPVGRAPGRQAARDAVRGLAGSRCASGGSPQRREERDEVQSHQCGIRLRGRSRARLDEHDRRAPQRDVVAERPHFELVRPEPICI